MNHQDQTRLGVGIVGVGKVGAVLGNALRAAGHAIVGVTAASDASRDRADAMLPGVPVLDIETVVERSELLLFTVRDDVLPDLVRGLAELGHFNTGQIVLHCAGRFGTEVLAPAAAQGAITLALHPSLSFTGTSMDVSRLQQSTIAVTGSKPFLPIGQALVVEMGAEPIIVAEGDRPLYHTAIAHAANHTAAILGQALEVLGSLGIENPSQVLHALVDATVVNTLQAGPSSLTGPVSRGDVDTVRAHLVAAEEFTVSSGSTQFADTYRALCRATVARALANRTISDEAAAQITDLLA